MKLKLLIIVLLWITNVFSKSVDELLGIISSEKINMQYYFWTEDGKAFLSSKGKGSDYSMWHFTNDKKWQPIHNADGFDGFEKAGISFDKVDINLSSKNIVVGGLIDKNIKSSIIDLVKSLENKTMTIKWYFWAIKGQAFLCRDDNDDGVRIWHFTSSRKWQPIHNTGAYDGYPLAIKRLENVKLDYPKGVLKTGNMIHIRNESNIMYLKENHTQYSGEDSKTPTPNKNKSTKTIKWSINAKSKENASKLSQHISFMLRKLREGKTPRKWDKLFIMESYMKINLKYTTAIKQIDTKIEITKIATTSCAFEVISAHSDAVSGDFFKKGEISNDYSSIAEDILASSSCDKERESIKAYILENIKSKHNNN